MLTGQSLIRAAELRSVTTEFSKYHAAVNTFRDKYFALPGDMTNATSFWGDQATGTASCANASTPDGSPGTCDGNGDGMLGFFTESYRFWQHLALAGLIEGNYQGWVNPAVNVTPPVRGRDVPASKISNGYWQAARLSQLVTSNVELGYSDLPNNYIQYLILCGPSSGWWCKNNILKPEEAWNIDTKIDDGKPAYGKVRAAENCVNSTATAASASYDLTNSSLRCLLGFVTEQR